MHDIAVLVGEHLHLDMARAGERAFQQQASVAEGMLGPPKRAAVSAAASSFSRTIRMPRRRRRPQP